MTIDGKPVTTIALEKTRRWRSRQRWSCVRPRGRAVQYVLVDHIERAGRYRRCVHLIDGRYYTVAPEHPVYVAIAS